jgi:glycosyltransferase involved in cell wall biosynthesis
MSAEPFVSVVTPVYNGEPFLAECIESVLLQDYTNWEYVVVNNCSTDGSLARAEGYARREPRIRIVTNKVFVNALENHNNAFREISAQSKYCKVVSADDRLVPQALGKMVRFAERNPTVGIVGSRQQSKEKIKWQGLPEDVSVLSGREACRLGLLQGVHIFGNPTSVLYRSDLIRRTTSFFPHSEPHADTSACYASLRECDFGFIHEVLSVERVHEGQVSSRVRQLGADYFAYLEILIQYGPFYLSEAELATRREELLTNYYRMLGSGVLKIKGREFWEFHQRKLNGIGSSLDRRRVLIEALHEATSELRNPVTALLKLKSALMERKASRPRKQSTATQETGKYGDDRTQKPLSTSDR